MLSKKSRYSSPWSAILSIDEMVTRHDKILQENIPAVDYLDINAERQFAPEYSQTTYLTMKRQEKAIGSYLKSATLGIKQAQRKGMILHIEDLWKRRNYKIETFYLAANIADHYLMKLASLNRTAPCLVHLGTTALFLAAKIEESLSPCVINLIILIKQKH